MKVSELFEYWLERAKTMPGGESDATRLHLHILLRIIQEQAPHQRDPEIIQSNWQILRRSWNEDYMCKEVGEFGVREKLKQYLERGVAE